MLVTTQSLEEFYQQKFNWLPENLSRISGILMISGWKTSTSQAVITALSNMRAGLYKINLVRGRNIFHYADKSIEINGTTLTFLIRRCRILYEVTIRGKDWFLLHFQRGLFTERMRGSINDLPMFAPRWKAFL